MQSLYMFTSFIFLLAMAEFLIISLILQKNHLAEKSNSKISAEVVRLKQNKISTQQAA